MDPWNQNMKFNWWLDCCSHEKGETVPTEFETDELNEELHECKSDHSTLECSVVHDTHYWLKEDEDFQKFTELEVDPEWGKVVTTTRFHAMIWYDRWLYVLHLRGVPVDTRMRDKAGRQPQGTRERQYLQGWKLLPFFGEQRSVGPAASPSSLNKL